MCLEGYIVASSEVKDFFGAEVKIVRFFLFWNERKREDKQTARGKVAEFLW